MNKILCEIQHIIFPTNNKEQDGEKNITGNTKHTAKGAINMGK